MKQPTNPVKAIREWCLQCCGDSPTAVKECGAPDCALYHFRFGKNPYRTKRELSEDQKKVAAETLEAYRESKRSALPATNFSQNSPNSN